MGKKFIVKIKKTKTIPRLYLKFILDGTTLFSCNKMMFVLGLNSGGVPHLCRVGQE